MTREEFENLLPANDPKRASEKRFFGNFGISKKAHEQQIEGRDGKGLQIGDVVFYLKIEPVGPINQKVPEVKMTINKSIITEE